MKGVKVGNIVLDKSEERLYIVVKTAVEEAVKEHQNSCPLFDELETVKTDLNGHPGNGGGLKNRVLLNCKDIEGIMKLKNIMVISVVSAAFTFLTSLTILALTILL